MHFATKFLAAAAAISSVADALPVSKPAAKPLAKRGFDPNGSNNVAAWWGNSDETNADGLAKVCAADYDIIILTFASALGGIISVGGGGEPASLGSAIKQCQSQGKKVMMSLGGANGAIEFASDDQAASVADSMAASFLTSGSGSYYGVALDGIDVDNETGQSAHWQKFVSQLRTHMNSNQYISGAPQCPFPDQSIDTATLNEMDFVWVQFYNNAPCNHGSTGFADSVQQWSKALTKPKLYIGTPGSTTSAPSGGYIEPSAMTDEISKLKAMNLPNLGGYALWDASTAMVNNNYESVIKQALGGGASSGGSSSGGSSSSGSSPSAAPSATTPAAAPTSPAAQQPHGQNTGTAVTVQATSTAVVTSTAFVPSPTGAAAPTSTPVSSGGSSSSGSSLPTQSCSNAGGVVCSSDGSKFGICDGSNAVMMAVAQGMTCSGGSVVGANTAGSGSGAAPAGVSSAPAASATQ